MRYTNKIKSLTTLLFILLLSFLAINMVAMDVKVYAATEEVYDSIKVNVPSTKVWSVAFNMELDKSTVNTSNVFVYEKGTTRKVPITVSLDSTLKKVSVKPVSPYTNERTYVLMITDKIKTKNKDKVCKPYKLSFKVVDNVFAGLPAEDGLVVIDNIAYSAKYLNNHKAIVNEIATKGYYGVYYVQDYGYQNVKSLFNTTDFTGKKWIRKYDDITYVDANGVRHAYSWKKDKFEYEEVLPAADISIISRSDIKLISVKVTKVYGVPGAVFFKAEHSSEMKNIGGTVVFTTNGWGEKISFYSADKLVVAKGYVYVGGDNTKKYVLTMENSDGKGNTTGNINNNGIAAMDDDGYIYYSNPSDKEKLYKMGFDGVYNVKISDDKAQYINILNGWVYYSNYTDSGKLYKIKTDGSGRTKVLDDKAAYVTISKNNIFYSNHSDGGKLYKIKTNPSDVITTQGGNLVGRKFSNSNEEVAYLDVCGDWIYYSNITDGNKPYLLNQEGVYKAKISDEWAKCIQTDANWIYYSSGSGVISKISKDSSGYIIPIKAKSVEYNKGYHINVVGNWIYYSNYDDGGKLYKVKADGSGDKIKLSDEQVGYINILSDFVYFNTTKGKMFRVPIDSDGTVKAEELGKAKVSDKITLVEDLSISIDYDDVNQPLKWLQDKYLPDKVSAIMGDNTMRQLVVSWDKNPKNVKIKDGVYVHTGTIVGYKNIIKCNLMLSSEMLNDTNEIAVFNNAGKKDSIRVMDKVLGSGVRLQEKDVVYVYSDDACRVLLSKATVTRDKVALISKLDFNPYGQNVYLTVQRMGKAQSRPTTVVIPDVPIIDSTSAYDGDDIGLGVNGRDFILGGWTKSGFTSLDSFSALNQNIYIVPSKTQIDLMNQTPVSEVSTYLDGPWQDNSINRDSKLNLFKGGNYDIYVALNYKGTGTPDISGNYPIVVGKVSSEFAAGLSVIAEYVPDAINISSMRVQGNTEIILPKAPKVGEVVWIAPVGMNWIAEKSVGEECPFNDKEIEAGVMSKLIGNGIDKVIYTPNNKGNYKVYVLNNAASSKQSTGTIAVDDTIPVLITRNTSKNFVFAGDPLMVGIQKDSEKLSNVGKVYITMGGENTVINSVDDLIASVKQRTANVVSITRYGLPSYKLATSGLIYDGQSTSYRMYATDEAGNLSEPTDIWIVKDTYDLEAVLGIAEDYNRGLIKQNLALDSAISKSRDIISSDTATQREINAAVKALIIAAIRVENKTNLFIDWDTSNKVKSKIDLIKENPTQTNLIQDGVLGYYVTESGEFDIGLPNNAQLPLSPILGLSIEWVSNTPTVITITKDSSNKCSAHFNITDNMDTVGTIVAVVNYNGISTKKFINIAIKTR